MTWIKSHAIEISMLVLFIVIGLLLCASVNVYAKARSQCLELGYPSTTIDYKLNTYCTNALRAIPLWNS
jgi:hypothetical protein